MRIDPKLFRLVEQQRQEVKKHQIIQEPKKEHENDFYNLDLNILDQKLTGKQQIPSYPYDGCYSADCSQTCNVSCVPTCDNACR